MMLRQFLIEPRRFGGNLRFFALDMIEDAGVQTTGHREEHDLPVAQGIGKLSNASVEKHGQHPPISAARSCARTVASRSVILVQPEPAKCCSRVMRITTRTTMSDVPVSARCLVASISQARAGKEDLAAVNAPTTPDTTS